MIDRLLLYDTFNARYFSFKDIADSFVVNNEYLELTKDSSMLLMGSRGCGKTTLLKMLTPAGLNYWDSIDSSQIKEDIKFRGIYIPSDIQWKNQFDYLIKNLKKKDKIVEIIIEFLFSCNVNIALCKTFKAILDFEITDPKDQIKKEFLLSKGLIDVWKLESNIIPTLDNVETVILKRVKEVNSLIKKLIFFENFDDFEENVPNYVFDDFFDLVKLGSKVAEDTLNFNDNKKWALCFDELEIVPKFLQIKLVSFLRSVDQKFIFKLTTTPLLDIENNEIDVTQGNDFGSVKLWVYDEESLKRWTKFSNILLKNKVEKKYSKGEFDENDLFGNWSLDSLIVNELNDLSQEDKDELGYTSKGRLFSGTSKYSLSYYLFKRLAIVDSSFKEFISKRKLDPSEPFSKSRFIQKSVFYKYKVDALYRLIFKGRSRRNPPIHFGIPYIYDICDGNPRLLIGLLNEMLQVEPSNSIMIPENRQSIIILRASEKFFNLLQNHPDSTITINNFDFNLATDLIDRIGKFFFAKSVSQEFNKSCPTTFVVDEDVNAKIIGLLETALHLGAIVYLDPVESLSKTSVVNKRFRLSAFLTPKYKIPNRISSRVRLSVILSSSKESDIQTKIFENV
jgi:energy-coupling factor transporter ATP-binding protein EcfA2